MEVAPTKQQAIYRLLKQRIMDGTLAPGRRIIIEDIAKKSGLSIIPVREALQTLQSERLVQIRPHAGATVSPIAPENITEIFTLLEGIEAVIARRIATHRPERLVADLAALVAKMDQAEKRGDAEKWASLNIEFHLTMSEATGMPWVHEITTRLLDNWDRIRRHFFRGGSHHNFASAQKEHRAILAALRAGQGDIAEKLARQHNQHALRHYSKI